MAIETSCDETGAAVIDATEGESSVMLLSNIIASSLPLHATTGGIVPENAAREQLKFIIPVINQALKEADSKWQIAHSSRNHTPYAIGNKPNIDAIAVTVGPGLVGSLLVGVETAKALAYIWNKPIIPVNHLIGHMYANWVIANNKWPIEKGAGEPYAIRYKPYAAIAFPAIALVVSGGHTDLVLLKNHGEIKWLGGTLDDAAGETMDKIGRVLGLPYPGGPEIERRAKDGNPKAFKLPRPLINKDNFDFSFSGLKSAAIREILKGENNKLINKEINDFCASLQAAIIDVLVSKTLKAAKKYKAKSILLGGGVAANQKLRDDLELNAKRYCLDATIFVPQKSLCTDNAAMIASAAFFNYAPQDWRKISANPDLYFA